MREWFKAALLKNGYGEYELLAAEARSLGYEISKSALHREGSKMERRLSMLRDSKENAKAVVDTMADTEGVAVEAANAMLADEFMQFYVNIEEHGKLTPKDLSDLARGLANLSKSTIMQKLFASKVRKEDAARLAKLEAEAKAAAGTGKKGLDPETLRVVREQIYGF